MDRTVVSQLQMVNDILRIGHGDLSIYTDIGLKAVQHEPELFAHLISWNSKRGEVRDSKKALPIIALRGKKDPELFENACASLCLLSPRDFLSAIRFHKDRVLPRTTGGGKFLKHAIFLYLKTRESNPNWWDRTVLQHRKTIKELYALNHIRPDARANEILFKRVYPSNSIFTKVKQLKDMSPKEAAGTILNNKIPFLIAIPAMQGIKDKPDVILALIENMTKAQLINNANALTRWGVMADPVLKSAYEEGLAKKKGKVGSLKATKAAEMVTDKKVKKTLKKEQEKQLDSKGIEGDWLVLGDRSTSMRVSLEISKQIAAFLARSVKGKVHLVLFNTRPTYFDVTGKTFDEIKQITNRYGSSGATSIGCGLGLLAAKNIVVNGIAICSDGGDNTHPWFYNAYRDYAEQFGIKPTCYLWHVPGDHDVLSRTCEESGIQLERFSMGKNVDYNSIPNLALTMRTNRYSLVEEILDTKLLTYKDVFEGGKK